MTRVLASFWVGAIVAWLPWPWTGIARADVVRFALVVGNNRGLDRGATLRFAEQDAQRLAGLLIDLGGFEPDRVTLLLGASRARLLETLDQIDTRMGELVPGRYAKALLLVYFSGHADGVALELGQDRLAYSDLRQKIEGCRASIRIALIDACQSGGLTKAKGGMPGPAFELEVTDPLQTDGTAVLTSSGAGENSQEATELQGSFFTSALLAGLRGAADQNQDRRVTLAEVYEYAYDRTVLATSRTLGGTQHPTFGFGLTGRGKLVLAELDRAQATLQLGSDASGEFLVVRRDTQEVIAELTKPFGVERVLALPPGSYQVKLRRGPLLHASNLTLKPGDHPRLELGSMHPEEALLASGKRGGLQRGPLEVFVRYGMLSGALKNLAPVHQGMVGLRLDLGPTSLFPSLSFGEANISEPPLRYHLRLFSMDCALTWRFESGPLDLFAGISLGISYGAQSLPDGSFNDGTLFGYAAVGGLDLPLTRGLSVQLFWEAGASVFVLEQDLSQHFALKGVVGLGYQF